jgi:site-specific recombinase XerD
MSIFNLHIRFTIRIGDLNQNGLAAIRCRLTYNKNRKDFSTGITVNPDHWNPKKQRLLDQSDQEETTNMQLSLIENKISKAFLMLQIGEEPFTVQDIYNAYLGKTLKKDIGIVEVWNLHNERIERFIGKEIVLVTYQKYLESLRHLKDFIRYQFKASDIPLRELKMSFINEYIYYLKTVKNFQQSTLNKAIQRLRKVVKFAIGHDYLDKDPFLLYRAKSVRKELVFLTVEELQKLEKQTFQINRIQVIKDCFVFCCYTGLAFKEMVSLKRENIVKGYDGEDWIKMKRQKTQKELSIPLLPKAKRVLMKYASKSDQLLPVTSNAKFNAYLKEIADVVGIEKRLTHHVARRTFATTVLLFNNVPMEVVSELLGHSKMTTTQQSYGKIVRRKVGEEMKMLNNLAP